MTEDQVPQSNVAPTATPPGFSVPDQVADKIDPIVDNGVVLLTSWVGSLLQSLGSKVKGIYRAKAV